MSLTRVSPALFQVSNNITSVTVGGSANTVSLTFDSNGVITGASNNALSVANTQITGLIQAAQIGSANATLATSGTLPAARLPAGSVLQVVSATTSTSVSSSTTTYADTGLTATITPKFSTSIIFIIATHNGMGKTVGNVGNAINIKLLRGATDLGVFINAALYTDSLLQLRGSASLSKYDSPATTSATTYKTQFANISVAASVFVNEGPAISTITLMEIAG